MTADFTSIVADSRLGGQQWDRMIFGHFIEHFHTQIYGGLYHRAPPSPMIAASAWMSSRRCVNSRRRSCAGLVAITFPITTGTKPSAPAASRPTTRPGACRDEVRAQVFVYSRHIQVAENALIGCHDELLVVRAHGEAPAKNRKVAGSGAFVRYPVGGGPSAPEGIFLLGV
jgi:hypothetical protein